MLEFAYPLAFLALPLPLLVRWLFKPYRQSVSALRVPFFESFTRAAGAEPRPGAVIMRRRAVQMIAAIVIWVALLAGIAKPEWVGEPIVRTEAARDIMLAIDLSGSMDYGDFPDGDGNNVSRFTAVQRVVGQFVAERDSDRIGLIGPNGAGKTTTINMLCGLLAPSAGSVQIADFDIRQEAHKAKEDPKIVEELLQQIEVDTHDRDFSLDYS